MSHSYSDFFDTDGRPEPADAASLDAERKLKVWAVLNAVEQGLMTIEEAGRAYGISPSEMETHRVGWLDFEAGRRQEESRFTRQIEALGPGSAARVSGGARLLQPVLFVPRERRVIKITEGCLPLGRPTLICGSVGCGKILMGIEFLVRGI